VNLGKWIGLVALCISLYILWEMRQALLLGFTAVILASALNGLVRQLTNRHLRRGLAVFLAVVLLLGVTTVFCLIVIPPFIDQFQQLAVEAPKSLERISRWLTWLETQIPGQFLPDAELLNQLSQELPNLAGGLFKNFFALFSNSLVVLLNILLVFVLMMMFLVEPDKYRQIAIRLVPSFYRQRADHILNLCEVAIDSWIAGILFNMLIIAICSGVGLWILGVRLVLANALIAGLLEAIPNIGPALSVIPPMAIALLDAPWKAGAVLILYVLIQQLEQYLLVPTVMAKQVALPPAVTLLSQIVFTLFFGFLGLLLALPLVIVGKIVLKEVLVKDVLDQWHAPELQGTPHTRPPTPHPSSPTVTVAEAESS
jgi:predicted PurR-regulated permease PerM